ncbi:hypothetical protein Pla108_40950 [Botrimarina colliarenosi]|uniref:Preprotein translocase subunit SecB n=1 Tax=Botrimarina colliarenosi TaxID=2528001 RepID=A0A5C5ZYW7_9BACT|nr:hypothetical protein [Botrimarina colliarenosi]TWT92469.1 hypothetical protein Pla108_40950 [Botrimarina colliarenosi]
MKKTAPVKKSGRTKAAAASKKRAETVGPLQRVQLRLVRMVKLNAGIVVAQEGLPTETDVEVTASCRVEPDDSVARVVVDCKLTGKAAKQVSGQSKLTMHIAYEIIYGTEEQDDAVLTLLKESAEHLANHAALVAWPYIRETVQSTAGRMGLPPILLPIHHFGSLMATPSESAEAAVIN